MSALVVVLVAVAYLAGVWTHIEVVRDRHARWSSWLMEQRLAGSQSWNGSRL